MTIWVCVCVFVCVCLFTLSSTMQFSFHPTRKSKTKQLATTNQASQARKLLFIITIIYYLLHPPSSILIFACAPRVFFRLPPPPFDPTRALFRALLTHTHTFSGLSAITIYTPFFIIVITLFGCELGGAPRGRPARWVHQQGGGLARYGPI